MVVQTHFTLCFIALLVGKLTPANPGDWLQMNNSEKALCSTAKMTPGRTATHRHHRTWPGSWALLVRGFASDRCLNFGRCWLSLTAGSWMRPKPFMIRERCAGLSRMDVDVVQGCPTRGPHAAREVVLSGPRCNKFVSRLFKFLVFFYSQVYLPSKHTKILPVVSVMGLSPENLCNKHFKNMSIF